MIDKCRAERSAIITGKHQGSPVLVCFARVAGLIVPPLALFAVFPDAVSRLCQFHCKQALKRWETDSGGNWITAEEKPSLSRACKVDVIRSFTKLQRVDTKETPEHLPTQQEKDEAWEAAKQEFLSALRIIIRHHIADDAKFEVAIAKTENYFERNWFTEEWRSRCRQTSPFSSRSCTLTRGQPSRDCSDVDRRRSAVWSDQGWTVVNKQLDRGGVQGVRCDIPGM